ncbi:MAG: hypothetical protein GX096_04790 [Clostridiales bacterium]|nr:hypothetical protein [Clostridiales bacterium]
MMKKRKTLHPLGAGINDYYSQSELLAICEQELFAPAKRMDTALLTEALHALDERSDEEIAPNRAYVWAKICEQTCSYKGGLRKKIVLIAALLVVLLALASGGLAWAFRTGVLSFPSLMLSLPLVSSNEAQSLVQTDLFQASYEHCELRVREAVFDGHHLRIVYSLRDTRPNAALSDDDLWQPSIAAAQLDGIGCCDYLLLDGQDLFFEDIYQLPSEEPAEMLYYLAANINDEIDIQDTMTVTMPIGTIDLETRTRLEIPFTLDTTSSNSSARSMQNTSAVWDHIRVEVVRAEFSPIHALLQVHYEAIDPDKANDASQFELYLFSEDGTPLQERRLSSYGGSSPFIVEEIITEYIPRELWPEKMVLAPLLADGSMDSEHMLVLQWEDQ